jgi:hypothetical protein
MASDHISATMTYVMWHEEPLWNDSVLQEYIFPILSHINTNTISKTRLKGGEKSSFPLKQ